MARLKKIIFLFLIYSSTLFANTDKVLLQAQELFKSKKCEQVLSLIENRDLGKTSRLIEQHYLMGKCYNIFFESQKAISSFQLLKKAGSKNIDIDYELGIAFYRVANYEQSVSYFKKSYELGYKKEESLFYMGKSSYFLSDFENSKKFFLKISDNPSLSKKLRQVALFEVAQTINERFSHSAIRDKALKRFVIPFYEQAIKMDPKSPFIKEIKYALERL